MNLFRIIAALIVIASAVLFAVRHQSLRQLQNELEALRQRSEEASNLRANAQAKADAANSARAELSLSAAERSELLRLRGQITRLRQELETNQPTNISRATGTSGAPEEPAVTQEETFAKMNLGKQWILALLTYAEANQRRLPASLSEAAPFASTVQGDDSYELLQSGLPLPSLKAPSSTIVLREKRPWKGEDGHWRRTYAFADGHAEIARSETADFTEWEKSKTPSKQDADRR